LVDAVSQDPILQRIFATLETFNVATLQETLHHVAMNLSNVVVPALHAVQIVSHCYSIWFKRSDVKQSGLFPLWILARLRSKSPSLNESLFWSECAYLLRRVALAGPDCCSPNLFTVTIAVHNSTQTFFKQGLMDWWTKRLLVISY